MTKLGTWRWYCGVEEGDDEMADCGTREDAIAFGLRENSPGDSFWIVEARMRVADEDAMGAGKIDCAPFADTRNGVFIAITQDGKPNEGASAEDVQAPASAVPEEAGRLTFTEMQPGGRTD